jgi:hypothetical protein
MVRRRLPSDDHDDQAREQRALEVERMELYWSSRGLLLEVGADVEMSYLAAHQLLHHRHFDLATADAVKALRLLVEVADLLRRVRTVVEG